MHGRTESIKNAGNTDFYTILALKAVSEGFCNTFAFVVAGADPNRVDMTPAGNTVSGEWNGNVKETNYSSFCGCTSGSP
jgi:hypothetical protein